MPIRAGCAVEGGYRGVARGSEGRSPGKRLVAIRPLRPADPLAGHGGTRGIRFQIACLLSPRCAATLDAVGCALPVEREQGCRKKNHRTAQQEPTGQPSGPYWPVVGRGQTNAVVFRLSHRYVRDARQHFGRVKSIAMGVRTVVVPTCSADRPMANRRLLTSLRIHGFVFFHARTLFDQAVVPARRTSALIQPRTVEKTIGLDSDDLELYSEFNDQENKAIWESWMTTRGPSGPQGLASPHNDYIAFPPKEVIQSPALIAFRR